MSCRRDFVALCNAYGIEPETVRRDVRDKSVARKRRFVANELRALGYSLAEIGSAMWRHHSTIINLLRPKSQKKGQENVAA